MTTTIDAPPRTAAGAVGATKVYGQGEAAIRALDDSRSTVAIPKIDFEFRLFRFHIVTIADEGQLGLIFVPGWL